MFSVNIELFFILLKIVYRFDYLIAAPIEGEAKFIDDGNDNITNIPKLPKCCPLDEALLDPSKGCTTSDLEFEPPFSTEAPKEVDLVIGLICEYGKYRLEPEVASEDEFHLLTDGSLHVPFQEPPVLSYLEYCLENAMVNDEPQVVPFLCFPPSTEPNHNWRKLSHIIFPIGSLTSVPFLSIVVIVYLGVSELRTTHGKVLASHSACLALAYFSLSMVQLFGDRMAHGLCVAMAFFIQFSFMSCFFWLNLLCLHTWRQLNKGYSLRGDEVIRENMIFLLYSLYGWGLPVVIISVSVIMDLTPIIPSTYLKPNFGLDSCWFHSDHAALPYFYGPIAILLIINVILFVLTTRIIYRTGPSIVDRITKMEQAVMSVIIQKRKRLFLQAILLFLAMGLNWLLEVVSWAVGGPPQLWLITDIINTLQGVIVFYIFVIRDARVRHLAIQYFRQLCCCKNDNTETNIASEEELRGFMRSPGNEVQSNVSNNRFNNNTETNITSEEELRVITRPPVKDVQSNGSNNRFKQAVNLIWKKKGEIE